MVVLVLISLYAIALVCLCSLVGATRAKSGRVARLASAHLEPAESIHAPELRCSEAMLEHIRFSG